MENVLIAIFFINLEITFAIIWRKKIALNIRFLKHLMILANV